LVQDWLDLSYDAFRGIWFDTRHTLFAVPRRGAGRVLRRGPLFPAQDRPHAVDSGQSRSESLFELRTFDTTDQFPALPEDGTGFAGFRLLGELEVADRFQEYAVFQGASYFRAIGRGQAYGLSARGLALNTAGDGPEEFPVFRDFWIEAAEPGAPTVTVHALMDSPSVAGAYTFRITKGDTTRWTCQRAAVPARRPDDGRDRARHVDVPVQRHQPHPVRRLPRGGA
jgi:periplasmic glucans biosynthesis protein